MAPSTVRNPYQKDCKVIREPQQQELCVTEDKHPLLSKLISKLRPFQREALEFAVLGKCYERQFVVEGSSGMEDIDNTKENSTQLLGRGRILLADEMGLGKTVTSLAIMGFYEQEWPLLVVCPASLRYQWPAEIERFFPSLSPSETYVCTGFQDIGFLNGNKVKSDVKIVVVTYSLFQQRSAVAHAVAAAGFRCVIVDESHNLKQKDSQRTALLLPMLQQADRLILLSGTPALARPVELWTSLYALAPKVFGSWSTFTKQYCNVTRKHVGRGRFAMDYSGACNMEELHEKLRLVMVRRLKSVVLAELPPKQRTVIPICVSNEHVKACKEAIEKWQCAPKDDFEGQAGMMKAYQETGVGKAPAVADYVSNVWLPGCRDKILIFAHHTMVLDAIEESLHRNNKTVSHIRIDGSVPTSVRAREVRKFQNNTNCRVALLSITAAGVGLTLTAASTVLFAELHWTPGILAQAEDRAHRIGQTASQVQIIYMIDKNKKQSIDSTLWYMLGRKISTVDKVIDGKTDAPYLYTASQNQAPKLERSQQDQLVDFFAEQSETAKGETKNVPVKGTIESFFHRANKTPSSGAKRKQDLSSCSPKKRGAAVKTPDDVHAVSPPARTISWSCKLCTLDNSAVPNRNGCYQCQVCDEPHLENRRGLLAPPLDVVSTTSKTFSAEKEQSSSTLSHIIDLVEIEEARICPATIDLVEEEEAHPFLASPVEGARHTLAFSVSKNTGRIIVHRRPHGGMVFNFDLHDILTNKALDDLSDSKMHRKYSDTKKTTDHTLFQEGKMSDLSKQLLSHNIHDTRPVFDFVRSFLQLSESEKKFLRDSGETVTSDEIHTTVARLMATQTSADFNRYVGGAKERAREHQEQGIATEQDQLVLQGLACAWCAKNLTRASLKGNSTYCNEECARTGRLKRGGMFASAGIRSAAFAIENGRCSLCGIDAHALFRQICSLHPAERLNKLLSVNWKLPTTAKAMENFLQNPKEGQFWQVDHKIAVAEGGGGCGLENLRTLCVPCHTTETEKLRGRLKIQNAQTSASMSGQQLDIRKAFGKQI